tara:strand:- start:206 stop:406 length:201 start_codon:yes stop_codon:yes gene_type:complete
MQFILNLENGKQIDMSSDILKQISGEITKQDVQTRIDFYKSTNKNKIDIKEQNKKAFYSVWDKVNI